MYTVYQVVYNLKNTWASSGAENAIEICKYHTRKNIIRIMMKNDRCFLSSYAKLHTTTITTVLLTSSLPPGGRARANSS